MRQPTTPRAAARAQKHIDDQINAIFCRRCSGIEINIMDIGKVFAAGRAAAAAGHDIETAIVARVTELRKNMVSIA